MMAISMKQLTLTAMFMHTNVICQLYEEQRLANESLYLPLLYDEFLRKQVARRAEQRDPDLDLETVFVKLDQTILETCKSRLSSVISSLQPLKGAPPWLRPPSASLTTKAFENTESLLAKETASAEAVQRRAEAASSDFAKQQELLKKRALQGMESDVSNRQRKSMDFLRGKQAGRSGSGRGYGRGDGQGWNSWSKKGRW